MDINGEGLVFDDEGCHVRAITNKNSMFDRAMGNPGKRIVLFKESADRSMQASVRVMPGCFITGQAAGTAASLACKSDCNTRNISIKELQSILIENGAFITAKE